jgi:Domain of unknown function (DUF4326)
MSVGQRGNPFRVQDHGNHAKCTILHKQWLDGRVGDLMLEKLGFCPGEIETLTRKRAYILTHLHELAGKDLICWCPLTSPWCHAETYLDMAPECAELESAAT